MDGGKFVGDFNMGNIICVKILPRAIGYNRTAKYVMIFDQEKFEDTKRIIRSR
jgi:hypothetical protein